MEYQYPKDLCVGALMLRLPPEMEVILVGDTLDGNLISCGKAEDYVHKRTAYGLYHDDEAYPVVEMVFDIQHSKIVAKIVVSTCGD